MHRVKPARPPLHVAAALNDNPAVVTVLLDAGANPKAKTSEGKTVLDLMKNNDKLKDTDAYQRLNEQMSDLR